MDVLAAPRYCYGAVMIHRRASVSKFLASVAIAFAVVAGGVAAAPATASPMVGTTFNPNACIVKLGWNNQYKYVNGVWYQRYGINMGPGQCPREAWYVSPRP